MKKLKRIIKALKNEKQLTANLNRLYKQTYLKENPPKYAKGDKVRVTASIVPELSMFRYGVIELECEIMDDPEYNGPETGNTGEYYLYKVTYRDKYKGEYMVSVVYTKESEIISIIN